MEVAPVGRVGRDPVRRHDDPVAALAQQETCVCGRARDPVPVQHSHRNLARSGPAGHLRLDPERDICRLRRGLDIRIEELLHSIVDVRLVGDQLCSARPILLQVVESHLEDVPRRKPVAEERPLLDQTEVGLAAAADPELDVVRERVHEPGHRRDPE